MSFTLDYASNAQYKPTGMKKVTRGETRKARAGMLQFKKVFCQVK